MAKLTNPLFSLSAHGTIKKTISFLSNGVQHNAKFYGKFSSKRKEQPSEKQIIVRQDFQSANSFLKSRTNLEKEYLYLKYENDNFTNRNNIFKIFIKQKPSETGFIVLGNNEIGEL